MKLEQIRRIALSLPEVAEQPHFDKSSFRVRGKIFLTVPPGDEYIHVFLPEQPCDVALALEPAFIEKLSWGGKVVGLRIAMAKAKPAVVKRLVEQAWASKAPKALAARRASRKKKAKR